MKRSLYAVCALIVFSTLVFASSPATDPDATAAPLKIGAVRVNDDETVSFNTNTLKYHCVTCQWAKKCTKNCIKVKKAEAKSRGGVACKVCRGSC
jgi:hypothetical protein